MEVIWYRVITDRAGRLDSDEFRATSWKDIRKRSKYMRGQLVPNNGDVQGFYRVEKPDRATDI